MQNNLKSLQEPKDFQFSSILPSLENEPPKLLTTAQPIFASTAPPSLYHLANIVNGDSSHHVITSILSLSSSPPPLLLHLLPSNPPLP
eukprot:751852-Hanusia_phi.AAC.4